MINYLIKQNNYIKLIIIIKNNKIKIKLKNIIKNKYYK